MNDPAAAPSRKRPVVFLGLLTGAILLLLSLVWCGIFLYWARTLRKDIRRLEVTYTGVEGGYAYADLVAIRSDSSRIGRAGCRALPYLIEAMNATNNPLFQNAMMEKIQVILEGPLPGPDSIRTLPDASRWTYEAIRRTKDRKQFLADFNSWWKENGGQYHQGWRVWSDWCPGD